MTINKISRSGTSVVTLAELQSGSAIFVQKASRVTTAGPVITGGLVSQADIIKRGVQVQTIVGRALANPYGSVFNFFDRLGLSDEAILLLARQVALADQFFITHNTPKFLLNKGLSDSEPILERISLRIAAFRVFEDAQFVSTATKFTLIRPLADDQSLLDFARIAAGYQRAAADIQTIVDTRLAITIGKANQDTVTQSDSNARDITALKQDQVISTEDKALTVGKGLSDGVRIRNRDDPGPALFVTKLLRDATTILDLTGIFDGLTYQNIMYRFETIAVSDNFARTFAADRRFNDDQSVIEKIFLQRGVNYQDTATPTDNKQLAITVQRSDATVVAEALQRAFLAQRVFQDAAIMSEVKTLTAGLGKTDVAAMLERLVNAVSKANTDTAIVTENIIGKSSIKGLTDSIISSEAIAKLINKGLADEVTIIEDILILLINFIRINADSVNTVNAQPIFSVGKRLTDTTVNLEQNFKLIGKAAEDNFSTIDNRPVFAVSKYLADIASMSDLAAAFDGITYNYGLGRLDETQATDEFIRQFTAFRTFEDTQTIADIFAKARGIGFPARSDDFSLIDSLIIGKLPVDTLSIGSGEDQRSRAEERTFFNFTLPITTNYRTQIDDVNFFAGAQENLIGIVSGQTFAGSMLFASTSAGASVQVTSTGTGLGVNGGFATVYANPYISFNGAGNRTVATVPIDFTAITSVSINFAYIAGNMINGGEQPDLNEDLIIEYSIDDSATFVTADTIAAISTYGSPGWSQYTSSLPTAAKTSSTILRWRQTKQSISTGDNWGITNIQLGGTSFGTFIRTYYDNNTASIAERIGLGRFQRAADTVDVTSSKDRGTLQFTLAAKQSINRSFSGTTVTAKDTDRLFIGRQDGTGTLVTSIGTLTGTTSLSVAGNRITWSEDFTTSRWTGTRTAVAADQTTAPDGTLTADKITQTGSGGLSAWREQLDVTTIDPGVYHVHSVYVKGLGSSVGKKVSILNWANGSRVGGTSVTLTADWQRMSQSFVGTGTTNRDIGIYTNAGGIFGITANFEQNQSVFVWGYHLTQGLTLQAYNEYTRTTSTTRNSGTVIVDVYTTSNTFITGVGVRLSSEPLERVSFLIGRNPQESLTVDETTRFQITSSRKFNESAAIADNDALDVSLTAYRGVAGQVELKTINAAGNGAQSSVLFSYGAQSPDVVGTIDLIFVAIIKTASFADTISIGSDIDQRQSTTERISFAITKANTDSISISDQIINTIVFAKVNLDTATITERPVFDVAISKTDTVTAADVLTTTRGKGLIEIVTVVDNLTQSISLLKADNQDVAENRIFDVAVSKADNITQQSLIALTATKPVSDQVLEDDQSVKLIGLNKVEALDATDRNNFDVALTAYRGVAGTVTLNTIDPNPDVEFEQSSVTVIRGARSPDEVGMLDLFSLLYIINRQIEDAIAAADDRAFFTITKTFADSFVPDDFLTTFDGLTYAGFMLRQDSIDAAHRIFLDIVLGARSESIDTLEAIQLTQGKINADSIVNIDVVQNSISLLKAEIQYVIETRSFAIDKLLQDDQTIVDETQLTNVYIRSLADDQSIDELKALSIGKYNADVFDLNDVLALISINNKFQFDAIFNEDAAQFAIGKFTDNTVTGSDILAFNQSKTLSDSFEENDAVSQALSLVKTDDQLLADRSNLSLTLLRSDSASLDDVASLIGAFNRSVVDDLFVTQEPVFFTITKQLSDNFVPDDFLQTFDGLTYAYATSRYDEIINSQRVYLDMVLGARTDTVVSLEQILVAQLKRYDDSVAETDQLQLRIDNLINNIAIAADVQAFSVAAIKADFIAGDERKYLDIAKSAATDTISLADLIDLILFVPTPDQFYFDTIFISDATAFDFGKDLSGLPVAVAVDVAIKFDVAIVAHRGVAGTVTLNTIDPSPDVEFEQSSVTVSRSSADNDEVGMLDFFSLTYATVRSIEDFIAITDISRLDITKLFNDSTVPDDFLQTFDGLTYATTILKQDVISIGLPGFTGPRVSGDDRERIAIDVAVAKSDAVDGTDTGLSLITGKGNSDAIDNADTLVLNVSILKTDEQIVEQTQRFFDITAVRTDEITNLDALRKDISKLLGTEDVVSMVDLLALVAQYQLSLSDIQSILAEKDGHFSYLLAQTLRNDDLSVNDDRLASFISKDLTNLDGLNNINTMVSNGTLRMTDYADIDYFAEDYVGESRSFT